MNNPYSPPNNNYNSTDYPINPNPNYNTQFNQINASNDLVNLSKFLKSSPQFVSCPFCNHHGITQANQHCNCCNILCCICTSGVCWILFQAVRTKDINCYDADHYCTKCNNKLASYSAC